jgi:LPXTG-motif cell wall-anchored protein
VEGVVVTRELPRTGSTTLPLLQVGLGLILLGAGALLFGRERTALI